MIYPFFRVGDAPIYSLDDLSSQDSPGAGEDNLSTPWSMINSPGSLHAHSPQVLQGSPSHFSTQLSSPFSSPSSTFSMGLRRQMMNSPGGSQVAYALEAPLPSVRHLSLRCLDLNQGLQAAAGSTPRLPLSLTMPQLQEVTLLPQFLPHSDAAIDRMAGLFSEAHPLLHLDTLTAWAPLIAPQPVLAGCCNITQLILDSCYPRKIVPPAPPPPMQPPQQAEPEDWVIADDAGGDPLQPELAVGAVIADLVAAAEAAAALHGQQGAEVDEAMHVGLLAVPAVAPVPPPALVAAAAAEQMAGVPLVPAPPSTAYSGTGGPEGPAWLRHLHLLRNLRYLELQGCDAMVDEDCGKLAAGLPGGVRELKLVDCVEVRGSGAGAGLQELARSWASLRTLSLVRSAVLSAKAVVRFLEASPYVESLRLESCSPLTAEQSRLILKRLIAAGRSSLDISYSSTPRSS